MKKWKSFAKWPFNGSTTSDGHDTKDQAVAVCRMLEKDGWGGEGEYFPSKTWIEKI